MWLIPYAFTLCAFLKLVQCGPALKPRACNTRPVKECPTLGPDPAGWQHIPSKQQKPDNTFADLSVPQLVSEPPKSNEPVNPIYGVHQTDIPMGRLHLGYPKFFAPGELNTPTGGTDAWGPNKNDYANQSACGIPDSAFQISKVAIHPYFIKYAPDGLGFSRFCMQDVSISIIRPDWAWGMDMIMKVTDVCCTDLNDPSCCHDPTEIKVDRSKMQILFGYSGPAWDTIPEIKGTQLLDASGAPVKAYWMFTKSWDDSKPQPAYTDNWWAQPPLPNNEQVPGDAQQVVNNNATYPCRGFEPYPIGGYFQDRTPWTITDWSPDDCDPEWETYAGGWGWGNGHGSSTWRGPGTIAPGFGSADNSSNNGTDPISVLRRRNANMHGRSASLIGKGGPEKRDSDSVADSAS